MTRRKFATVVVALCLLSMVTGCAGVSGTGTAPLRAAYDFEEGVAAEWSWKRTYGIEGNTVLGLFNSRNRRFTPETRLNLSGIAEGAAVDLSFDLYLIGTWDSEGPLADRFQVAVQGGGLLLDLATFPNRFADKEEKVPEGHTGFVKVLRKPRAYWRVRQRLAVPAEMIRQGALTLLFKGHVTGRKTEYWALDNVAVTWQVPGKNG